MTPTLFAAIILLLLIAKFFGQLWLDHLNQSEIRKNASTVPPAFRDFITEENYFKSVQYSFAKIKFGRIELMFDFVISAIILFSGILPWFFTIGTGVLGTTSWGSSLLLIVFTVLLFIPGLPFSYYNQFVLEEKFGFNTSNFRTWILDRLKGLALLLMLGWPILALLLTIIAKSGPWWWFWGWCAIIGIQLVMMVLAPIVIMPLFNKFKPLEEGTLRQRLLQLGEKTGFSAKTIQVMDGSKRSRHSNAFFTGFGKFRKIVLFDTLISQLDESELEAVLAHEIGHYKKAHIPKMLAWGAITSLLGLYLLAWLTNQPWFFHAFGLQTRSIPAALLLFTLTTELVTFWFTPLGNLFSRKFEFEADAFASDAVGAAIPLIGALRKLNDKNLSNLTPHPRYSAFYYSHPTLVERERALKNA
ncbi:MAG: peptidase [Verrucomicrobiales bacterium]|nr:peptidase [Verrucomicrobiales bacterium]